MSNKKFIRNYGTIKQNKNFVYEWGKFMKANYNGLWKLLIDKNMKKADLIREAKLAPATVAKMSKGEFVSMEVLYKITKVLDTTIGEIVTFN
ncbi:helix-turn-helix transcriptional regulator [Mycoplasmopsis cynos]|nr:helix-turn-helix transcriptional regulator [Mycoplasmopsis cynos]